MDPPRKRLRLSTVGGNEPDIEALRQEHDRRFLGRLDGILQKYDRDFEGISDEIDMNTGQIVVNNGHVQSARDAYDIGPPARRDGSYIPAVPETQLRLARRQSSSSALAREIHNVVHHHYAPELHQNITQPQRQPDLASSMLQILTRIEHMEARNERLHLKLMDRLAPVLESSPRRHVAQLSNLDQTSPSWRAPHSVPRDRPLQLSRASHRQPHQHDPEPTVSTPRENANDKRRPWTPAEEQKVKSMRAAGCSFTHIARDLPSRSLGSIKLHWYNYLHPDLAQVEVDPYTGASLTPRRGDIWAPSHLSSPEVSPDLERGGDYEEHMDDSTRRPSRLAVSSLRISRDTNPSRRHDFQPTESDYYGRWKEEEDDYLLELVKQELKSKSGDSKWNRIIAKFIERYPNRRTASIKPRFTRIVPGGITAVSEFLRQKRPDDTLTAVLARRPQSKTTTPDHNVSHMSDEDVPARPNEINQVYSHHDIDEQLRQGEDGGTPTLRKDKRRTPQAAYDDDDDDANSHDATEELEEELEEEASNDDKAANGRDSRDLATNPTSKQHPSLPDSHRGDEAEHDDPEVDQQDMYDSEKWHQLQRQKRFHNLSLDHEKKWTREEIQRLEALCAGIPRGQRIRGLVEDHFPERSFRSIQTKLQKLRKSGRIPVDPDLMERSDSHEPDTELPISRVKNKDASPIEAVGSRDVTPIPLVTRPKDTKLSSPLRARKQHDSPIGDSNPHQPTPRPLPIAHPTSAVVMDSDQSEPPSTLGSSPQDQAHMSKPLQHTLSMAPPPRRRGRPSKAEKAAREAWFAAQQSFESAAPPVAPPEPVVVSLVSNPVDPIRTTDMTSEEVFGPLKPALKKPKRKSEPLLRPVAANSRNKTTPAPRKREEELQPNEPADPAFATPQMLRKPMSVFSAPHLQRSKIVPLIDDLSDDELA